MKIQWDDIATNEDRLEVVQDKLDETIEKFNAPEWLWVKEEWNQWNIDLVANKTGVKRLQRLVDRDWELQKSCYE